MKPRFNTLLVGSLLALAFTHQSIAATYNWIGGTGTWDTATANWSGAGTVWPAVSTLDDDAAFGGTAGTVTIATGGVTANDLAFNSTGYSIGGAALTLDGAPTITTGSGISATISAVISGGNGLTKAGAGTLTLTGANNFTGASTVDDGTVVVQNSSAFGTAAGGAVTVDDGATLKLGGSLGTDALNLNTKPFIVSGAGVGEAGVLVHDGPNTQINAIRVVTLAAPSTFGGTTRWDIRGTGSTLDMGGHTLTKTGSNYIALVGASPGGVTINNPGNIAVNQGELNFHFGTTLGATKTVTVNSGATFSLYQNSGTHNSSLVLNSGSTFRGENGSGTQNTWAGPVTATGEVTFRADGVLTINSTISGTSNITKIGGSTATIASTGSLANTGSLAVNAGTLSVAGSLANTGDVTLNGGTLTVTGNFGSTGNLTLNAGTMNINGTSSFTGITTVNAATLALNYATDDNSKLPNTQPLNLAGGTVSLTGGLHVETVGSTTLAAGTSNSIIQAASTGATIDLNTITVNPGAALNFSAENIAAADNANNASGILGTWATVAGSHWAVNQSGLVAALTDFVYTSAVLDDAALYQNKHVNVDSVQAPGAAITPLSLIFNTGFANSLTLQGSNPISSGGILNGSLVGNNASTLTGGSITGPNNGDLVINQQNTANTLTISSVIADNGTTTLLKTGPGTVILDASNTYTGSTTISAGSLQVNHPGAIGGSVVTSGTGSAALLLGNNIVVPATESITINGFGANQFYGALSTPLGYTGTSEWQGSVTIGSLTGTRIGTLGGTLVVSGAIGESTAGSQLLVRNNETVSGTTILKGNNTFSGGLQLIAGNLRMGSANALGSGTLTLGSGGNAHAFSSDSTSPRTISNPVVFNATTTHTLGDATLNGKLTFSGGAGLGSANRTLGVAGPVEFSSPISSTGTFGITKTGTGDLILSAANTYTGSTTINGGTLVVAHKDALATSSSVFPSSTTGSGTLRLATDTSVVLNRIETSSTNPGTVVSDRATAGPGINHIIPALWAGANTYTFSAGTNVTSGTAGITFNSVNLTAGSASTAILNPTTAVMTINGPVNIGLNNFAKTLRLDGTSSGNLISGVVSNNLNTLSILKAGTSTWELSGDNTYTGTTIVREGTLTLSGNRTNNTIGAITVCDSAGLSATLNISNGTHNLGAGQMNVGNSPTTAATGTVNQSGGAVIFSAGGGNQLLIGQNSVANRGIYNLSGGSLTIGLSTANGRGVMLGVNTGSSGGTFNLSGTGQLNMTAASGGTGNATLQVGRFDSAANNTNNDFNQTGGTANVGVLSIGGNGATGTGITSAVNLTGGTFSANVFARMAAGNTNTATLTIGGTADVTLPAFPTARGTSSTATLNFDGGVLKPTATSTAYIGGLTNAFIRSGGAKFNTNSFDITVSQNLLTDPVSTGGGLTKEGTGTLFLRGSNTYTGNTTVTAGTLSLGNGTANTGLANGADVSVASGATLNLNYSGTDTIDGLTINGVAKSPGVWGSSTSGAPNTDPQLTGSGTLTVTTGPASSAYDTWASGYGLTGPNAAFDFDFDNDGIDNGLEWILGGNPTTNSADILPDATRNLSGDLVLTFTREEDAIPETTLKVEFGTDLASWPKQATIGATSSGADANGVTVSIDTDASPDAVTAIIPASNAPSGRIFARLIATQP